MQDRLPPEVVSTPLVVVKVAHTLVWAVFAGCILAIPVAGSLATVMTVAQPASAGTTGTFHGTNSQGRRLHFRV
jgi:hypothetical protein